MKSYVNWVKKVQSETDPQGFDVRINPKFELPNGEVFVGGWCRPQTDGPGLRSGALLIFADLLIKNGQTAYVNSNIVPIVKYDLEWVFGNWQSNGCDLWEEVRSSDFFWNRMSYVYTFKQCESVFTKLGDSAYASRCSSTGSSVQASLNGHWTGSYMTESDNRPRDTSVIHAFSSFEAYSLTDNKVTQTIKELSQTFCSEYAINQQEIKNGVPGILMGRYPGDSYAGGNPWQLLTAVLAKTFYQGATTLMESNGFEEEEDKLAWFDLLKLPQDASFDRQVEAAIGAGDSVMYRLFQHVKGDNGHIAEQIDRNTGAQKSANDLTWSYANILSAMQFREKASMSLQKLRQKASTS
jgi:glucoamylase